MCGGLSRTSGGFSRMSGGFSRTSGGFSRTSGGFSRLAGGFSRTSGGLSRILPVRMPIHAPSTRVSDGHLLDLRRLRRRQRLRFPAGALGGLLFGGGAVEHGDLQHVLDVLDEMELHVSLDRFRDLDQVALVELRQDHGVQLGRAGGEYLLLDAADRQDVAAQRDFAGHGYGSFDRPAGEAGDDG